MTWNRHGRRLALWCTLLSAFIVALVGQAPPAAAQPKHRMAMILPGPTDDASFNTLGYQALLQIRERHGFDVSHSEKVAVADAERVGREYVNSGFTVVAFHGGQYLSMVQRLAPQFPNVTFVSVSRGQKLPPNVWNITRRYNEGYYPLGTMAALMTKTNRIGFIAGIRLPDFIASLNAVQTAIKEANPAAQLRYAFTGDQNDAAKALQSAQAMIGEGCDVILSMLDRGVLGVIEAAKTAPREVYFAGLDTDWSQAAPKSFVGALYLDFPRAYLDIASAIARGQRAGDYQMRPGQAMALMHMRNIPQNVTTRIDTAWREIALGRKAVPDVMDKILAP